MIIVSGTGRSGTSMWMQCLRAAGFPVVGDLFPPQPGDWVVAPNPRGYLESTLAGGIYGATNPNPATGVHLRAADTAHVAVKVFVPGVLRSQREFLGRVIVSMRPWRSFHRSYQDFQGVLDAHRTKPAPAKPDLPLLHWWRSHYALLQDSRVRGYPLRFVNYDAMVDDPATQLEQVLSWVGQPFELAAAAAAVDPSLRRSPAREVQHGLPAGCTDVMDEWADRVALDEPMSADFQRRLEKTDALLAPVYEAIAREQSERAWAQRRQRSPPG